MAACKHQKYLEIKDTDVNLDIGDDDEVSGGRDNWLRGVLRVYSGHCTHLSGVQWTVHLCQPPILHWLEDNFQVWDIVHN